MRANNESTGSAHEDLRLTPHEELVLVQMVQGLTSKQISEQLRISRATVQAHKKNMYKKLGAHSAAQAVFEAFQLGILSKGTFRVGSDEF